MKRREVLTASIASILAARARSNVTVQSALGSAAYTISGAGTVPNAPTHVTAYVDQQSVYVRFVPPSNINAVGVTSYTAITSPGGFSGTTSAVPIVTGSTNYQQLNSRVDIQGVMPGSKVTVTVYATNAAGNGPRSTASAAVGPVLAAPNPYYACQGNASPYWSDFSYGCTPTCIYYGTTPGTASRILSFTAPTNRLKSSSNVLELDSNSSGSNAAFQPYFEHINPSSAEGGRFNLYPYTNLIFDVWPTYNQVTEQQALFMHFEKDLFVDGAATSGNARSLQTVTDTTQNWPANNSAFKGAGFCNITTGARTTLASTGTWNTATTLTLSSDIAMTAGDFYEIEIPDVGVGVTGLNNIGGGGPLPTGVTINGTGGTTKLVSGQWNEVVIPLSTFNAGSGNYPTVTGGQILKLAIQLAGNSSPPYTEPDVYYLANVGFT